MARKPSLPAPGKGAPDDQPQDEWDAIEAAEKPKPRRKKELHELPVDDAELVPAYEDERAHEGDQGPEADEDELPVFDGEIVEDGAGDDARDPQELIRERIEAVVGRLQAEADLRVGKRQAIEQRWLEDMRQFAGRYDPETKKQLDGTNKSKLFINKTRTITNAMAARIIDLLFPTDDRNWGIQPSPVPELVAENTAAQSKAVNAEIKAREASAKAEKNLSAAPAAAAAQIEADAYRAAADQLSGLMDQARRAAKLMEDEIHDHLKACDYQAGARDVVMDACQIGTGVMKGPITGHKTTQRWVKGPNGDFFLAPQNNLRPSMVWIDPWSFFPDPEVGKIGDGEGNFVRHLCNKKQLRAFGRLDHFDKDALRRLLTTCARGGVPSYLNELRAITDEGTALDGEVYQVWEYSGPLTPEEMRDLALAAGDLDTLEELAEVDPLDEVQAVIWFCQGELLSFAIYPMDSGEPTYSVFCLEKDRTSIFGFGVPYWLRDAQKALNAGWRMMMDNSSAAAGSQIVVNKEIIEPENGVWEFAPRKIWLLKGTIAKGERAFDVFDVPNHQAEYANIITIAKENMDEEAAMPPIAQGEQGATPTTTAGGMALLMNSSNVVFRQIVKNFDDDFTTPNIRRMYHHEMQHSTKQHIKGDFEVDARGSSVLLVREMQAQNLIVMADRFAGHPVFGKMLKPAELLRNIVAAHMISADTLVLSDSEIEEAAAKEAEALAAQAGAGGADPTLEARKLDLLEDQIDAKVEMANQENETRRFVAKMEFDWKMAELAERMNMKDDELRAKLSEGAQNRRSKERTIAAEIGGKIRLGKIGPEIANT